MMKHFPIIGLLLLITLSACRKDTDIIKTMTEVPTPGIKVESSIKGQVFDENRVPVAAASVRIGNTTTTTYNDGRFEFRNITVDQNATVAVSKSGFFDGSNVVYARAANLAYTEIVLQDKGTPQTFTATDGGAINLPSGSSLSFLPNSIITQGGAVYNGEVKVFAKQGDPTATDFVQKIPGDLTGIGENGAKVGLSAFAQLTFELEGASGEKLEVAEGAEAEVSFEVPDELLADAPQEIPLWEFNTDEEYWEQTGICTLQPDGRYVGKCTGGAYACCKIIQVIHVYGYVEREYTNQPIGPASYLLVEVEDLAQPMRYAGFTDSLGFYCGYISKDSPLEISVLDRCDTDVYNEPIGPFSADTELATITLPVDFNGYSIRGDGQLNTCDNVGVTSGFYTFKYGRSVIGFGLDPDGSFSVGYLLNCLGLPEYTLTFYDTENNKVSDEYTFYTDQEQNMGTIIVCNEITDTLNLDLDGTNYFMYPTYVYFSGLDPSQLIILASAGNDNVRVKIENYQGQAAYSGTVITNEFNPGNLIPKAIGTSQAITISSDDGTTIMGEVSGILVDDLGNDIPYSTSFQGKYTF